MVSTSIGVGSARLVTVYSTQELKISSVDVSHFQITAFKLEQLYKVAKSAWRFMINFMTK